MRTIVCLRSQMIPIWGHLLYYTYSIQESFQFDLVNRLKGGHGRPSAMAGLEQLRNNTMARKDAIQNMKDVLIKRRDALRKALAGDLSMLKDLSEQTGGDEVDAALDAAQNELSSQLAEVESRELAHIENALKLMREGKYGHCESCSNSIPLARLQALPYATFCIDCQREMERTGELPETAGDWSNVVDLGDTDRLMGDVELDVS